LGCGHTYRSGSRHWRSGAYDTARESTAIHVAGSRDSLAEPTRRGWHIQVVIANTAAIAAQVAGFELDLGLIEGPRHEADLTVQPWREDELVVVAAAADPILPRPRNRKISLKALREATWLLRETGSGTREIIDQLLIPHLYRLRPGIEFGNSEAIKRAAASGLGVTCLSRCVVDDLLRTGVLVAPPTALPRLSRRFHIVTHERKGHTRGMDLLLDYLSGQIGVTRPYGHIYRATFRLRTRDNQDEKILAGRFLGL
jgi:DNA-binding transcriptional LysR family regulator